MCTGRVDLSFVLRAFARGADGVFIGGCWPGECHYVTEGNYDALFNMHLCRKLLEQIGVNPLRLRLEWIAASEGARYAEVMNDFGRQLKGFGPLGEGEGLDRDTLKLKLEALNRMVPYIKLVERERLRVRFATQEEYADYFAGEDFDRLFRELLLDKLNITLLTLLLRDRQLSSGEIAQALDLPPAEAARHLKNSTMYGLVRFDEKQKRFALA
ncbi:tungsten-dependent benzoyl-CoA reductase-related protein bamF [Geothermobacter ehrlichii]|uniref:Tungsten-dependent benzoyl-CoA reductase-related protein bamF n=2 Tax=Geothermobacter ehrlichii TaxID=213224 RepID=A0A5D3WM63_9BACT|nr:tungsten-dependent benzoyl-CoA reductase-related protein bamF [Geothermobacter ehrlichii]